MKADINKVTLTDGVDPVGEPDLILHIGKTDIDQTLRTL